MALCGLAFLRGVADFCWAALAGVLGFVEELVGPEVASRARADLPLRRAPADNTLSRYL